MKRLMTAAATVVALSAGAAYADCEARMTELQEAHADGFATRGGADVRNIVRDLQSSAIRLKAIGDDEGCEAVVQAMNTVAANSAETMKDGAATEGDAAAATDAEVRGDPRERVVAIDKADVTFNTSSLKGVNVYNYKDEFLGEVDGLLVRTGQAPTHLIIGHGGFWNIGDEEAAIPLNKLKWDPEWDVFYVDMTEEQLDNAPDYDMTNGEWRADENDSYYGKLAE